MPPQTTQPSAPAAKQRDPRLDFFRGLAMMIIFVAHSPGNWWGNWIPARFGFSDAAEMFVFCSGFAASIAFGGVFRRAGFHWGTVRVLWRCAQLYVAHLALFFSIAAIAAWGTLNLEKNYLGNLNLWRLLNDPATALVDLFTMSWVPNYFDIMPMYMVILAMIPLVVLARRLHPWAPFVLVVGVWSYNWAFGLSFQADRTVDSGFREWFFNPFGWQLLFFTGFAFGSGWLKGPPMRWAFLAIAVAVVLISIPLGPSYYLRDLPTREIRDALWPILVSKTDYGVFRIAHFFALAYIALFIIGGRFHWLRAPIARPIMMVGQQALPTFILSMLLAYSAGMALDVVGRTNWTMLAINLLGFAGLVAGAFVSALVKRKPWVTIAANAANTERAASAANAASAVNTANAAAARP